MHQTLPGLQFIEATVGCSPDATMHVTNAVCLDRTSLRCVAGGGTDKAAGQTLVKNIAILVCACYIHINRTTTYVCYEAGETENALASGVIAPPVLCVLACIH